MQFAAIAARIGFACAEDRVRIPVGFFPLSCPTNAASDSAIFVPMFVPESSKSDDVEHLLRNAQLRDELEPLLDESIDRVNPTAMSTRSEN
jgi:hypothetical protein